MFDTQFIGGTDLFGQCEMYRGLLVDPNHLINFTKKFENQLNSKKGGRDQKEGVLKMFTEQPTNSVETPQVATTEAPAV